MLSDGEKSDIELANGYFADHVLHSERVWKEENGSVGAIWQIRRPGTWCYFAEIVATPTEHALIVHGDVETCRFASGSLHPLTRLAWMGDRPLHDLHYPAEKAHIGTGGDFKTHGFDELVARREILEARRRQEIEPEVARAAYDYLVSGEDSPTSDGVIETMMDAGDGLAWERSYGRVYSFNIIAAVAAVRACYRLVAPGYVARNHWMRSPW